MRVSTSAGIDRALVTGATGHIGRALMTALTDAGVETLAVSRRPTTSEVRAQWLVGDLTDTEFLRRVVRDAGADVVFHLAGVVTGSRSVHAVLPTFTGMVQPTVDVMVAAHECGSRVVLAGSMEDPGPGTREPPQSPYAVAKECCRRYAELMCESYGARIAVARIFMVYGPGPQPEHRLVPYIIRSLLRGQSPALSSGSRVVDWVYVDDVVAGLVALAKNDQAAGRIVDLGTGRPTTIRDVGERLHRLVGASVPLSWGALPDRPSEREVTADRLAALDAVGWQAHVSLEDGLARTVAWFKENNDR